MLYNTLPLCVLASVLCPQVEKSGGAIGLYNALSKTFAYNKMYCYGMNCK